jgi:bisphosphoglycerate-independent phosphoglycerate mutase (AlkP superfamily)
MDYSEKGTTHGAGYNYDTHVPVVFYGWGINKGETYDYITITQIAPTVCELLKINQPNSTVAAPLNNYLNKNGLK